MHNQIIGLSGRMGAGKDAAADIIQRIQPGRARRSFAGSVKAVASIVLGTTLAEQTSPDGKQRIPPGFDKTNAAYQQIIGQGLRDLLGPDVWIRGVLSPAEQTPLLITDVRYPNEAAAIKAAGGVIIRIERDTQVHAAAGRSTNHPSETALDGWEFDYTVWNNGDLDQLEESLGMILQ
jgi:hypothetical protein